MKKNILRVLLFSVILSFGFLIINVYADEETTTVQSGTSISLMPVSQTFQLSSNSTYESSFKVTNDGESEMKINVYVAPYSYVYSNEEDLYKLGYNNENNYTQITRWITIKDEAGNYVEEPIFTIPANSSLEIFYRVTTPSNIPDGGQYAVIFAHTLSGIMLDSGIRTEASPGMVIYGRSVEGETIRSAEIYDLKINRSVTENNTTRNNFFATARVKNTGNVDFNARGVLKVESIVGFGSYETPETTGIISVIPESERIISDEWAETPSFGLYKVTWSVTVGEQTELIERMVFLISPLVIIITIIVLTILVIWIIIRVRKRKERRSRLAV